MSSGIRNLRGAWALIAQQARHSKTVANPALIRPFLSQLNPQTLGRSPYRQAPQNLSDKRVVSKAPTVSSNQGEASKRLYVLASLGALTLSGGTSALSEELDVAVHETGFSVEVQQRALAMKALIDAPGSSLQTLIPHFKVTPRYVTLVDSEMQALGCLLHEKGSRQKLIAMSLQDSANPLSKALQSVVEDGEELGLSTGQLQNTLALEMIQTLLPLLTNREDFSDIKTWSHDRLFSHICRVPESCRPFLGQELVRTGLLQSVLLDPQWEKLRGQFLFSCSVFTTLALEAGRGDLVMQMLQQHLDTYTDLPKDFLQDLARQLNYPIQPRLEFWQGYARDVLEKVEAHPHYESFLQSQRSNNDASFAQIKALVVKKAPDFPAGSWQATWMEMCVQKEYFAHKSNALGWAIALKLPLSGLCSQDLWDGAFDANEWLAFFHALPVDLCGVAFEGLSTLLVEDALISDSKSARFHTILAQLPPEKQTVVIQRLANTLGQSLRLMQVKSNLDASYRTPDGISLGTQKWLINTQDLGILAVSASAVRQPLVRAVLNVCRSQEGDSFEKRDLLLRFAAFFGFAGNDSLIKPSLPGDKAAFINTLLEGMTQEEVDDLALTLPLYPYACGRIAQAAFHHEKNCMDPTLKLGTQKLLPALSAMERWNLQANQLMSRI